MKRQSLFLCMIILACVSWPVFAEPLAILGQPVRLVLQKKAETAAVRFPDLRRNLEEEAKYLVETPDLENFEPMQLSTYTLKYENRDLIFVQQTGTKWCVDGACPLNIYEPKERQYPIRLLNIMTRPNNVNFLNCDGPLTLLLTTTSTTVTRFVLDGDFFMPGKEYPNYTDATICN